MTEPAPPPPPGYPGQPAPGYTPTEGPSGPRASFGRRLVALIVDSLILAVPYAILWPLGETASYVIGLLIDFAYFSYFEGSPSGQTIGKRLLSIRVIDFQTGGPIGYARAFGRRLAKILSAIACLLGYLWMLWDREKQTWHDKLVTSVVVPTSAYPVERWPG